MVNTQDYGIYRKQHVLTDSEQQKLADLSTKNALVVGLFILLYNE